jgi:hypothetical protein
MMLPCSRSNSLLEKWRSDKNPERTRLDQLTYCEVPTIIRTQARSHDLEGSLQSDKAQHEC